MWPFIWPVFPRPVNTGRWLIIALRAELQRLKQQYNNGQ